MQLSTLNFIHKTLEERAATALNAKKTVYEAVCKAEDNEAQNLPDLQALYEKVKLSWWEARDALSDFENQNW